MTKYNTLLKAKLQELLEARGLPIEGTKEVLIERLEESDKVAAELDEDDDVKEDTTEVVTLEKEDTTEPTEPTETKKVVTEEPKEEVPSKEVPTEATLETRVLELLNTKLKRAIKFNEEEVIKRLNSEILRINKFGVSTESAIVHELNGTKPKPNPKYTNKVVKRRTPKGFRNRRY